MGLRYRNGAPLYGKTLQTVLAERPCRVIVVGEPGRDARRPARARPPPRSERRLERRAPRRRPRMTEGYRLATRIFAVTIIGFGLAILVVTLARGGGPLSHGLPARAAVHRRSAAGRLYLALRA